MFFIGTIYMFFCGIYSKLTTRNCKSPVCLTGKTAIVTGGNAGIGYEVCVNLATRGCRVIIADKDDSSQSKQTIIRLTHNPNVISKRLDLSNFASIRHFAADINLHEEKVDILINNAGIGPLDVSKTVDGLNPIMQINFFGPFLLTHLLLGVLKKSESGRIIFTSSCAAFLSDLSPETFTALETGNNVPQKLQLYNISKLANIMAADGFAEKLKNTRLTSNSLHPGISKTNIFKSINVHGMSSFILNLILRLCGKTVWEAAQTTLHLAVSDEVETVSGQYFWDCRPFIKPASARNVKLCETTWKFSEEIVKLSDMEKI